MTDNDMDTFMFSFELGKEAKVDLEKRIGGLETRVDTIVEKIEVGKEKIRILGPILNLVDDPSELHQLGRALIRLSEILPELQDLKKRHTIIEASVEHPNWLLATFGDFSDDLNKLDANGFAE